MIWKIRKKCKLKCEMIWKIWKKGKSNSEKIWKIDKKIVKRYGKYGRKVGWIVKWDGKYGTAGSFSSNMVLSVLICTMLYVIWMWTDQYMKFVGKWAKPKSHKLHILSSRLIFFSINHIHIQRTCLSSLNQTQTWILWYIYRFRYLYFRGKKTHNSKYLLMNFIYFCHWTVIIV